MDATSYPDDLVDAGVLADLMNVSRRQARRYADSDPTFPVRYSFGKKSDRWSLNEFLVWRERQRKPHAFGADVPSTPRGIGTKRGPQAKTKARKQDVAGPAVSPSVATAGGPTAGTNTQMATPGGSSERKAA